MSQLPTQQTLHSEPDHGAPTDKPTGHKSASTEAHRAQSPDSVKCFVLTVSDTRTLGNRQRRRLDRRTLNSPAGHTVTAREVVRDEISDSSNSSVRDAMNGVDEPDAILVTGGSRAFRSATKRPKRCGHYSPKRCPVLARCFACLSWEEVGPATMLSRAFRRRHRRHVALFVLPGSTNAVKLAMEKLIVPELGHLVREANGRKE